MLAAAFLSPPPAALPRHATARLFAAFVAMQTFDGIWSVLDV